MGNTASGPLTHDKLFIETVETRGIMNLLLDYMLKNITVRDFLALSNPTECKKYVLFMANRLNQQFYELKIAPEKGKKDVIAFRSIKELVSPDDRTDKEKQSLCLTLAYFYTRIFQIYGALALTLMDDIDATRHYDTSIFLRAPTEYTQGLGTPGSSQVYLHGGVMSGGGDLPPTISIGNYEFLRSYLRDERQEPYGYSVRYDETKAYIYFSKENENRDERQQIIPTGVVPDVIYQNAQFAISYPGAQKYAYVQMTASKPSTSRDIKLQIKSLQYIKKNTTQYTTLAPIPSSILSISTLTIQSDRQVDDILVYSIKELKNTTIKDFFDGMFNKLVPYIKELTESDGSGTSGIPTPKNLLSPGFKSEDDIPPTFRIGRTIQNLQNQKPLAHCIARALQLLKVMPLGNEPGYSSICKAHFLETQTRTREGTTITYSRSGIPLPNDNLDESPGMSALAQLFYDTIAIGSPKLEINRARVGDQKSSLDEYREFMLKMARLFGDRGQRPAEEVVSAGLHGIKNRRDAALCQSRIADAKGSKEIREDIMIDNPIARKVKGIVSDMFKTQLQHASNCGKIFNMLFYIKKEKDTNYYTIRLHNNVIQGGIPEVDRINRYARKVLVDYYSNCETKYMMGMKEVLEHYHDKQLKAVQAKAQAQQQQAQQTSSLPQVQSPIPSPPQAQVLTPPVMLENPLPANRVIKTIPSGKQVTFAMNPSKTVKGGSKRNKTIKRKIIEDHAFIY